MIHIDIRDSALSIDEVAQVVQSAGAGGVVIFVGLVRDNDSGRDVVRLDYSAHPDAQPRMRAVAESVAARFPTTAVAAVHRVGELAVGDIAVIVAAACPHRAEAFAAGRALIDELKETVPIWKHQIFIDGSDEWVGSP